MYAPEFSHTKTAEGALVMRLAVDPFVAIDSTGHVMGWPDGTNQPSVAPHYRAELHDVTSQVGVYAGVTPFPTFPNALVWSYIQYYDPDIGVLHEMFYTGDIADMTQVKTFRTQRTDYGLKTLNVSDEYTAARIWSAGFTNEFSGTIVSNSGKSTVVQVDIGSKLIGPDDESGSDPTKIFRYFANITGADDPTLASPAAIANALTTLLPNMDPNLYRTVAEEGHCSVMKMSRAELPYDNFTHSVTGDKISQAYAYNPLYVGFYGWSGVDDDPASGTGPISVRIPFDTAQAQCHDRTLPRDQSAGVVSYQDL